MINEKLITKILELFKEASSLQLNEISKLLGIKSNSDDYDDLKYNLMYLCDTNILSKSSRRKYTMNIAKIENHTIGTIYFEKNKIFAEIEDGKYNQIYFKRRDIFNALDGDKVEIKISREKKNKIFGEVVSILERAKHEFVGFVEFEDEHLYIRPLDMDKYYVDFLITKENLNGAKVGQKVKARLLKWTDPLKLPTSTVIEVVQKTANVLDIKKEFDKVVAEFELNQVFPDEVIEEAKAYSVPKNQKSYKDRVDLRNETIITIDPFDAKDFDDALSLKKLDNGNLLLGVHIADVSYYVKENTQLDIEARFRGNSTYLVDRVIPMLPEELSNNICSLKPNEIRFAFSVDIEYDKSYHVVNYKVYESVIKSKRRFTYEEVFEIIQNKSGELAEELILPLNKLALKLRENRFKEGGIDFNTSELRFKVDENGRPNEVVLKRGTASTQLVEECMLAANRVVAKHVKALSEMNKRVDILPFIYRIHEDPDPKVINDSLQLIAFLVNKKIKQRKVSSKEINDLLHEFKDSTEANVVNQILIRSLPKAIYSHQNFGHFGLGFDDYTHFTSPIRRYADLIVHRFIKEYSLKKLTQDRIDYLKMFVKSISAAITFTERTSMETERAANKVALVMIAENYIGEEFEGTVTGVTSFGLFITVDKIFVEGLLHIKDITDDYYFFDEEKFSLIGRRKKKIYRIGSRIKVKIVKTNLNKRNIDFCLVTD